MSHAPRLSLPRRPSLDPALLDGEMGQHTQAPGQCHTHLGIKQAVVSGQAGPLVAELSREGRGLGGQEVLNDAHGAYQALHLCQGGDRWGRSTETQGDASCPSDP